MPVAEGKCLFTLETGSRPRHIPAVDWDCISSRRDRAVRSLDRLLPDRIEAAFHLVAGVHGPAVAMVFETGQFYRDDLLWQNLFVCDIAGFLPLDYEWPGYGEANLPCPHPTLPESPVAPGKHLPLDPLPSTPPGWRRFALPVASGGHEPGPASAGGKEHRRCEPWREQVGELRLSFATADFPEISLPHLLLGTGSAGLGLP